MKKIWPRRVRWSKENQNQVVIVSMKREDPLRLMLLIGR